MTNSAAYMIIERTPKGYALFWVFLFVANSVGWAQSPAIQWQKCLGGSVKDTATCIRQTTDGGYIVAGYTHSSDGNVSVNHGGADILVVKLTNTGVVSWQKTYGGSADDVSNAIEQTKDGGYIVAGTTSSADGDIMLNKGYTDAWIIKMDSAGVIEWQRTYGGSSWDGANAVQQTADGGYIVAAWTGSTDGDPIGLISSVDFWIIKLTDNGTISWNKCYGGNAAEEPYAIRQTKDGGYITTGWTGSFNGDVSGFHGWEDYWVLKLNDTGAISWQRTLGGSELDISYAVEQTLDGGYIVAGYTLSDDGDVMLHHGFAGTADAWVVKLDSNGNTAWSRCYGGTDGDVAMSIGLCSGGGYVIAGVTSSKDGDVSGCHTDIMGNAEGDYWVVNANDTGAIEWAKCYGGSGGEVAYSVQQTNDGGYVVAGYTNSQDSDVSGNHGSSDFWVVKLNGSTGIVPAGLLRGGEVRVYPNPVWNELVIESAGDMASVSLSNIFGQLVYSSVLDKNKAIISTKDFMSGIYFVQVVYSDGNKDVVRVVKE